MDNVSMDIKKFFSNPWVCAILLVGLALLSFYIGYVIGKDTVLLH